MIDYKGTKIVGVDMGYGNMKTAKTHFPTALKEYAIVFNQILEALYF